MTRTIPLRIVGRVTRAPTKASIAILVSLLLLAGSLLPAAATPARAELQTFERDSLVIETAGGARYPFTVELALDRAQQAQGLMFRRDLAPDAGMLFLYARVREVAMWMKNTLIPLDMLFIAKDGRVVRIAERAVPGSLETIPSGQPVAAVLELNGGTAARLGLAPGDRVLHGSFGTAP